MRTVFTGLTYVLVFGLAGSVAVAVLPQDESAPQQKQSEVDSQQLPVMTVSKTVPVNPVTATSVATITAQQNGFVSGMLTSISADGSTTVADAVVRFVRDKEIVTEIRSAADGRFQVQLEPGNYGVFAVGNEGFSATGLVVEPYNGAAGGSSELQLSFVVSSDVKAVQNLANSFDVPKEILDYKWNKSVHSNSPAGSPVVRLTNDGHLVGNVYNMHARASQGHVFIVYEGEVIAQAKINEHGQFAVEGLQPGNYSIVAASDHRFSASSIQVVDASDTSVFRAVSVEYAVNRAAAQEVNISTASFEVKTVSATSCPPGGGGIGIGGLALPGFGGGGGGIGLGGGAAAGGGGGALLLGGAAIAGGAVAISESQDDDGGGGGFTPIASPAYP